MILRSALVCALLQAVAAQRGVGIPTQIFVDGMISFQDRPCLSLKICTGGVKKWQKQNEVPIKPSCLRTTGQEIDRSELKSCINYFKGKGKQKCGAEEQSQFCELRHTVVVVTARRPGYVSVDCKDIVTAMQWVADKCSDFGGMYICE
jgi:hypothetical protein